MNYQANKIIAENFFSPYFLSAWKISNKAELVIELTDPQRLLVPERLDLVCKLHYIDCKEKNIGMDYAKSLYAEHIKAFSSGTYTEPGTEEKNSLDKYFNSFDRLIADMKIHGFDSSKSVIPVSDKGVILDGAHRVAIAIYYHLPISITRIHGVEQNFNYDFFYQKGLALNYLDFLAYQYLLKKDRVYVLCLWPKAYESKKLEQVNALIKASVTVFYTKNVQLNYNGLCQFMIHLYHVQEWTGCIDNGYAGVNSKADSCYDPYGKTTVYFIEGANQEEILRLKSRIRDIYQLEKHSVHITDTKAEAIEAAQVILNSNSIHLMNYGKPFKYADSIKKYMQVPIDEYTLQNNSTLALYGISPIDKVDFIKDSASSSNPDKYLYYLGRKSAALQEMENGNIFIQLWIHFLLKKRKQATHSYKAPKLKVDRQPSKTRRFLAESFENNKIGLLIIRAYRSMRYRRKPKVYKNIVDLRDAFEKISNVSDYLVLRNWEGFYDDILLEGHNDIDLLCASSQSRDKIVKILDAKDITFDGYHYSFLYKGNEITLDIRIVGDNYYDAAWQINMLKNKKKHPLGFYVMSDEDYFYSLAYHAIYQKSTGLSNEYRRRLDSMNIGEPHTQDEYISILDQYMKEKGYLYTKPTDESVVFIK